MAVSGMAKHSESSFNEADAKQANNQLSDDEIDIVMKCLSSNNEDRYKSCKRMIQIIRPYVEAEKGAEKCRKTTN